MSARILDCSDAEYYSDPCDVPSLSQSCALTLLTRSPLHAWNDHPKLGNNRQADDTDAKDEGSILHKLLLGEGKDLVIIAADNFRTKFAQELRDEAYATDRVPVLVHKMAEAEAASERIRAKLMVFGIDLQAAGGVSEMAFEWEEDGEHGPVRCRGKADRVHVTDGVILDVKKIRNAHPMQAGRDAVAHGHDIQWAAYVSALEKLKPQHVGRVEFVNLYCEFYPPYAVLVSEPDGEMRELGERRWNRAVLTWERCLRTDTWPSYANTRIRLAPSPWALKDEEQAA